MPTYRPSGDKRKLSVEEHQQRVLASGYSYIPKGGIPKEPEAAKPVVARETPIRKPDIVIPQKPGDKKV